MILLQAAGAVGNSSGTWQSSTDMDSFYVLVASLLLAFIAFVILMRVRF